jgi:hypothetical protein
MTASDSRRTLIDDSYPTCERTCAQLLIYPGNIDPRIVTQRLGVEPTSIQRAGETIRNSLGRERTVPMNGWFLSSEGKSGSLDLRRHLDWLLERLTPHREALAALQGISGMKMSVNCIWWSAQGQGGPTLWPEQMSALAELGLECSFDIGFYNGVD